MCKQAIRDIGDELYLHIAGQTIFLDKAPDTGKDHDRPAKTVLTSIIARPLETDSGMRMISPLSRIFPVFIPQQDESRSRPVESTLQTSIDTIAQIRDRDKIEDHHVEDIARDQLLGSPEGLAADAAIPCSAASQAQHHELPARALPATSCDHPRRPGTTQPPVDKSPVESNQAAESIDISDVEPGHAPVCHHAS